ncbi:MAG: type II 3-dehydroquinate dehydratase [Candidatus Marinimicrobia bacterium]|nr:type II 3-dehydroquinate dehydratase [Candidatus Neomarinimicrobiota bacterium]MCF7827925.1 type II 3-dehydroquinate dehydratase [Candidatus Neomarinimicrobiota bacterium]MCF7879320.1 type II 3-dehydroquinate dehydratase [Candidatus Neomarinimicrobiota bacterium]
MSADDSRHILVIHGPNMNLVGKRPKETFGTLTLDKINRSLRRYAQKKNVTLKIFQSNSESDIVTKLQRQRNWADGILLNPATLCFTSYTILDTLELINLPTVEVHLTDPIAGKSVSDSLLKPYFQDQIVGPVDSAYERGLDVLLTIFMARR